MGLNGLDSEIYAFRCLDIRSKVALLFHMDLSILLADRR